MNTDKRQHFLLKQEYNAIIKEIEYHKYSSGNLQERYENGKVTKRYLKVFVDKHPEFGV